LKATAPALLSAPDDAESRQFFFFPFLTFLFVF